MSTPAFGTELLLTGPFRSPRQMLAHQEYDGHASVHDDETAEKLGLIGAPIEGPTHFSQFDPIGVALWGHTWFERGCISSHFENMVIEGEKSGVSNGPTLIVTTNNSGAFTTATQAFQIEIKNFVITAASGVTGAKAYKQLDKSYYTAYAKFEGIETSSKLEISYDLFPIFCVWSNCRDGYIDAALAQGHQAISAIPASWSQSNQCNINKIVDSDRKSTRLNSSHSQQSRMPSSA